MIIDFQTSLLTRIKVNVEIVIVTFYDDIIS